MDHEYIHRLKSALTKGIDCDIIYWYIFCFFVLSFLVRSRLLFNEK
jgi:uncharacterized membrane protein (DUF106 family)